MIIVIGHEKGGVGESQISFNLASYLAESYDVILVDTDTQATSEAWGANRKALGGKELFPIVGKTVDPGPTIVQLSAKYDVVVVDLGARDYARLNDLARIADLWIAPTRVGQGDLESTLRLSEAFERIGHLHKSGKGIPFAVVVNCAPSAWNSLEGEDAIAALRGAMPTGKVLDQTIRDRKVWRDAHKLGKSIFEMPPRDREKAEQEMAEFVSQAMEIANNHGGQK